MLKLNNTVYGSPFFTCSMQKYIYYYLLHNYCFYFHYSEDSPTWLEKTNQFSFFSFFSTEITISKLNLCLLFCFTTHRYLVSLIIIIQHDDSRWLVVKYHHPEISYGVRHRHLSGYQPTMIALTNIEISRKIAFRFYR